MTEESPNRAPSVACFVLAAHLLRGVDSTMDHTAHVDDGEKRTLEAVLEAL